MRKITLLGAVCPVIALAAFAQSQTRRPAAAPTAPGREEMRGLWVARWSLTSPQACRNVVTEARRHNFTTLFVQCRGRGDAWYASDLEPRAADLKRQPPEFDPLALMVEEGHRQGLQVHAWLNTYLVWTGRSLPDSPLHVVNRHPDWVARDKRNRCSSIATGNMEGLFLQASNPQAQEHLFRVFTDVASRYDVDGIHFDYVRYPNRDYDFADSTLARFRAFMEPQMGSDTRKLVLRDKSRLAYVHMFPRDWEKWRQAQVTELVRRVSEEAHRRKPWQQVSAAVFANAEDALAERGQDWMSWLARGYLDAVCPMAYSRDTDTVARQIKAALAAAGDRHVYAGIGSWRISAADTAKKVQRVRKLGAQGVTIFSYDGITRDGRSTRYLDKLTRGVFASRAAPPRLRWLRERDAEKREKGRLAPK